MWFYTYHIKAKKTSYFFSIVSSKCSSAMFNIEYLGILLSFYSVIFISIELSYPKIGSCRHGIVNILWVFEKSNHNILNKYLRKCSRIFSRWNESGPFIREKIDFEFFIGECEKDLTRSIGKMCESIFSNICLLCYGAFFQKTIVYWLSHVCNYQSWDKRVQLR